MVKTQLVIIQPTPLCNIDCRYCYLPQRSLKKRMEMATLAKISEVFFTSSFVADTVTIVWHASEPLVLPIAFYEQAFHQLEVQNTRRVQVKHSFQTNATLITQAWCDFFKRQNVQVGVSLDGPQHIHDFYRVDKLGRGTFERTMRGIRLLQENRVPFSVIAVVTERSLQHAEEIWRFFAEEVHPEHLGLNPEEREGAHTNSSLQYEESALQYKQFLQRFLTLNACSSQPLNIREFEAMKEHIMVSKQITRSQTNVAGVIFSFDCDGNISTFSPEMLTMRQPDDFLFGNVFMDTLEDVLTTQKFQRTNKQIQHGISRCLQTCDYFMFCGGGFPSNKLSEHGTFDATETQSCRLRVKVTADTLLEYWEEKYHLTYQLQI